MRGSCASGESGDSAWTYLLLANGQANEADALDGLAAEQPKLLLHGVFYDVFQ